MSIRFFYDNVKPAISSKRNLIKFIEKVIQEENKVPGDLNFIFTDDETLLLMNTEFLGHDYYTDVITFGEKDDKTVNGEVYLSVDRIKENAEIYNVKLEEETLRVLIHGVLHLCGYDDKSEYERRIMRDAEGKYIKLFMKEMYGF